MATSLRFVKRRLQLLERNRRAGAIRLDRRIEGDVQSRIGSNDIGNSVNNAHSQFRSGDVGAMAVH